MRIKGYSDKLYNKKFYTATRTPVMELKLSPPAATDSRGNFRNKPENKGGMLWMTAETSSSPISTDWLDWASISMPTWYFDYKYVTEIQFDAEEILVIDTIDYYVNGIPVDYFTVGEKDFGYWDKYIDKNPFQSEYKHFFDYAREIDAYKLALDYQKISKSYTGVYVSYDVATTSTYDDTLKFLPLSDFYTWNVETLVIWDNDAVKKIINHDLEHLEEDRDD